MQKLHALSISFSTLVFILYFHKFCNSIVDPWHSNHRLGQYLGNSNISVITALKPFSSVHRSFGLSALSHVKFKAQRYKVTQVVIVSYQAKSVKIAFRDKSSEAFKRTHDTRSPQSQERSYYLLLLQIRYRTLFPYKPDPMPSFSRHTLRSRIQTLNLF